MTKFTNHAAGPRGINLKDGTTRWVEPGETVELSSDELAGKNAVHPDFKAPKAEKEGDEKPAPAPAPAKQEPKA